MIFGIGANWARFPVASQDGSFELMQAGPPEYANVRLKGLAFGAAKEAAMEEAASEFAGF